MTAKRVVILAAAAIVLILAVTGTYYFVLPPGASATVTIVATGALHEACAPNVGFRACELHSPGRGRRSPLYLSTTVALLTN